MLPQIVSQAVIGIVSGCCRRAGAGVRHAALDPKLALRMDYRDPGASSQFQGYSLSLSF